MLYQTATVENGKMVITSAKEVSISNEFAGECWLIQFDGLEACSKCDLLNTSDCGGKTIRKKLYNL